MKSTHVCREHHHQEDREPVLDHALEKLKASGHKLTRPRVALLNTIVRFHGPFSTEDLFQAAQKSAQKSTAKSAPKTTGKTSKDSSETSFDLVTVYRNVATFAELKILNRVDLGDGTVRYEINGPTGHHHHHFVCTSCQRIEPLGSCDLDQIHAQEQKLASKGYGQISHRLEFFGLCPDCTG